MSPREHKRFVNASVHHDTLRVIELVLQRESIEVPFTIVEKIQLYRDSAKNRAQNL